MMRVMDSGERRKVKGDWDVAEIEVWRKIVTAWE